MDLDDDEIQQLSLKIKYALTDLFEESNSSAFTFAYLSAGIALCQSQEISLKNMKHILNLLLEDYEINMQARKEIADGL